MHAAGALNAEIHPHDFTKTHNIEGDGELVCDPDGVLSYGPTGHGTHVAGLVAANGGTLTGPVSGTCPGCGLSMVKFSYLYCDVGERVVRPYTGILQIGLGVAHARQVGAQVVNMSLGAPVTCSIQGGSDLCAEIAQAKLNDILMVGASGNNRTLIQFPAWLSGVAAVGGTGLSGTFWDFAPNCPGGTDTGCGSNRGGYPPNQPVRHQELVAPAVAVVSTFFPGKEWNSTCTDKIEPIGDGIGPCTGTSMSAPVMSGIYGLLRSINPMMRVGDPYSLDPAKQEGIRRLVQRNSSVGIEPPEDFQLGAGTVDAAAAVKAMLGRVEHRDVKNRVTPLFGLYSSGANDHAAVAIPQLAMALSIASSHTYGAWGDAFPVYQDGSTPTPMYKYPNTAAGTPKAVAFVLTTAGQTAKPSPPIVPLYRLERRRASCDPTVLGCHGDNILVSSEQAVQEALNRGYQLAGKQGFIYSQCSPYPSCKPTGSEPLYLGCNGTDPTVSTFDCAVFLERHRASLPGTFETPFPGTSSTILGYAYPVLDSDNDRLPDALELTIGTRIDSPDSDGDQALDRNEYPLAEAWVSDPCVGAYLCSAGPDQVFRNGFE